MNFDFQSVLIIQCGISVSDVCDKLKIYSGVNIAGLANDMFLN